MCLHVHNTAVNTVVHMEIMGMRPWDWVLRLLLLLLLLLRGFVENVTSAVKLVICVGIAQKQRAKGIRSRQKTPEACTESVTHAFV